MNCCTILKPLCSNLILSCYLLILCCIILLIGLLHPNSFAFMHLFVFCFSLHDCPGTFLQTRPDQWEASRPLCQARQPAALAALQKCSPLNPCSSTRPHCARYRDRRHRVVKKNIVALSQGQKRNW